jgi:hypothetical protein
VSNFLGNSWVQVNRRTTLGLGPGRASAVRAELNRIVDQRKPDPRTGLRTFSSSWAFYDPNLTPTDPNREITGKVYFERET